MSILSFEFLGFVLGVVVLFYSMPVKLRWVVLLLASLGFYAVAGWQSMAYLLSVTAITYLAARLMEKLRGNETDALSAEDKAAANRAAKQRKAVLLLALVLALGALLFIKYFDVAKDGLNSLFSLAGWHLTIPSFAILVPLGLSYFTFQSVGYIIDVYRGKYAPQKNPLKYLLFVSFFPQIAQGPISPYPQLAPQLYAPRRFSPETFVSGFQLALWGYFKKLVLADRLAPVTFRVAGGGAQPGWLILFGVVLYAIRLYADFSGGMDIIRGVARMLGVDMVENFKRPFFSLSVAEYWRRWHISLGVWFRSYVFYPLCTSHFGVACGKLGKKLFGKKVGRVLPGVIATIVIFLFIGIWHMANWNAVLYGTYFGLLLGAALLLEPTFKTWKRRLHIQEQSAWWKAVSSIRTLVCILIAQYFAFTYHPQTSFELLRGTFANWSFAGFSGQMTALMPALEWAIAGAAFAVLLLVDILCERGIDVCGKLARGVFIVRWVVLIALILAIVIFGCYGEGFDSAAFLYTQF